MVHKEFMAWIMMNGSEVIGKCRRCQHCWGKTAYHRRSSVFTFQVDPFCTSCCLYIDGSGMLEFIRLKRVNVFCFLYDSMFKSHSISTVVQNALFLLSCNWKVQSIFLDLDALCTDQQKYNEVNKNHQRNRLLNQKNGSPCISNQIYCNGI